MRTQYWQNGSSTRMWLAALLVLAAAAPVNRSVAQSQSDLVAKGKYIATAADCGSCHAGPDGKAYAGGSPLKSAFGIIYGSNITPDEKTGIGTWTKADFERALRKGIRKDGAYIYPAMPYNSYTKMTPADIDALWAYMRSVAPVANTPPENTLPFPLTVRSGMAVWQSLYFKPGEFVPEAKHDATWNRGAYLVQALGHCNECHTPRNAAQGLETKHQLTGAQIEGWYAPDISNDPMSKIAAWKTADLAKYLQTGVGPGNQKSFGPMQEVVHDSLRNLTTQDLTAMAVYLKDQQTGAQSTTPTKPKLDSASLATGKQVYEENCSSCHQSNGKGIPGSAPALAGNDAVTASEPYNVIMAMLEGFPPQGNWGAMGSFAKTLSDDQIADVTNYVRTAWGNGAEPNAAPWSVGNWRKNANIPQNEQNALLCPNLPNDVAQPALGAGPAAIKAAAAGGAPMNKLVGTYMTARPKASTAQVIEALSTAYCQTVSGEKLSQARVSAQISSYAQQVAVSVSKRRSAS